MEPEPYVWAIYVSSFAAVGRNKGYNQLYLIQLGEARKLGNRNERRREGKRWATLPPTVSDTVGFGYLSNVFFCGLLAPSPGNLPGSAATGVLNPAMHKASDAGHIGPHGMRRCLSFSYTIRGRAMPPPRQKSGSFLKSARCA